MKEQYKLIEFICQLWMLKIIKCEKTYPTILLFLFFFVKLLCHYAQVTALADLGGYLLDVVLCINNFYMQGSKLFCIMTVFFPLSLC